MLGRIAWTAIGLLLLVAALELLLRLLPVSTATLSGYHIDPLILNYPPGHRWQVSTGWDLRNPQKLRANNVGFASDKDFVPDARAVAIIGDSFVEASMLAAADRPAAQLEAALQRSRPVYGMGGPGSSLLDYAERIRFAAQRLHVRDFVVLMEAGDVRQSMCGSGNVHAACLDRATLQPRTERQPPPSTAKRWLRHSALAQYLVSQLKVEPARLMRQALAHAAPPEPATVQTSSVPKAISLAVLDEAQRTQVHAVAHAFIDRAQSQIQGRLVLVVDGRRNPEQASTARSDIELERDEFVRIARERGVTVLDAEDAYREHATTSRLSLAVGPYDNHLNRLGVQLLMNAAAQALQGEH